MTNQLRKKRLVLATASASLLGLAAWAAIQSGAIGSAGFATSADDDAQAASAVASADLGGGAGAADLASRDDLPQTYVVVFRDAPLATYKGEVPGLAAPTRKGNGRGRIEAKGHAAKKYVDYLEGKQRGYEKRLDQALGRDVQIKDRWQHALNAVVTTLSPLEAEAISRLPEVLHVEANHDVPVDTDVGPQLIGATNVWAGIPGSFGDGPDSARGEGVVVGIIDSGINFGAPSFSAVDPVDGYVHVNPNGAGTYLGTCAPGGVDAGRCNDKLIGGYDFVCGAPGNSCGVANRRDEPGFGDTSGHGSHTASTTAGNHRTQRFNGSNVSFSGVAPRANIIAYDVCYTEISTGRGLCPSVSSAAAANQAIADGVDVINFSIGGGTSPWNDIVSLAFLSATDAGIFVATSAGNSGPGAGTLGHVEPWTTASAAAQHGRNSYGFHLNVTGPTSPPPANLQAVELNPGSGGVELTGPLPGTTPIRVSPGINSTNDGCAAFPAGQFAGAIAVIRRGTCAFSIKTNNAQAAGAIAVIIANNAAGGIIPSVPGTTIPAFGALQTVGNNLRDYAAANPGVTGSLAPVVIPNVPDALAAFSSRGPSGFDLLKPDITAPGVNVLAAYAGTTLTGFENLIATISGTSMASPHTAGAAALMRQLHPSWTVMEIKSALQMTATESVLLEDQTTAANAHAAGSGRVQVDVAARAGLVLNETTDRFIAANPGTGGDTSALNLASMAKKDCPGVCTFVRTLRNATSEKRQWRLQLQGVAGTVEPASLTLKPGESRQVLVTLDNTGAPADGSWRYGRLQIEPSNSALGDATLPTLHMTIALSVPPPPPPTTPLVNGVAMPISGAVNSDTYYTIDVPAGQAQLRFNTAGGTGDLDLMVRYGDYPSDAAFNCYSGSATNTESCVFNAPPAGRYYVRIIGFTAYSGATLTASYP